MTRSRYPEELLYVDNFKLVRETLEYLKRRLEAWKGALTLKVLRINVGKTKMKISRGNAGKVTIKVCFSYAVCRNSVGSNSFLCQFYKCLV